MEEIDQYTWNESSQYYEVVEVVEEVDWDALRESSKVLFIIFLILTALANMLFAFSIIRKRNTLSSAKICLLLTFVADGFIMAFFYFVIQTKVEFEGAIIEICDLFVLALQYAFYFEVFGYCTGLILLVLEMILRKRIVPKWEYSITLLMPVLPWATSLLIVVPLSFVDVDYEPEGSRCSPFELSISKRKALTYVTNVIPSTLALLVSGAVMLYYLLTTTRTRPVNTRGEILQLSPYGREQSSDTPLLLLGDCNNFEHGQNIDCSQPNESLSHPETASNNSVPDPDLESGNIPSVNPVGNSEAETSLVVGRNTQELDSNHGNVITVTGSYPHLSDRNIISPTGSNPVYTSVDPRAFTNLAPHDLPRNQTSSANDAILYPAVSSSGVHADVTQTKEAIVLFLVSLCFFISTIPLTIFALLFYEKGEGLGSRVAMISLDISFCWLFYLKGIFSPIIWTIGINMN